MEPTPTPVEHDLSPEAGGSSSRLGPRLIIGGAIALLAAALAFVVVGQTAGDAEANTPEQAVEAMVAAIEASDLEAALDALAPGERDVVAPLVRDLISELGRVDLLATDIDLTAVPGISFTVDDLSLSSSPLADDLALVSVGGTVATSFSGSDLPIGPAFTDHPMFSFLIDGLDDPMPNRANLAVVTVRHDNTWYVSLGHTFAENLRLSDGWPSRDAAGAVEPEGHGSPEGVAEALAEAVAQIDVERLLALLNPGEADGFQRFATEIVASAGASDSFGSTTLSIDDLEYRIEVDGDHADIVLDVIGFTVVDGSGDWDAVTSQFRFEGGCVNFKEERPDGSGIWMNRETYPMEIPGYTFEDDGSVTFCPTEENGTGFGLGLITGSFLGDSVDLPTIGLVRHDGQWYLSPVRTVVIQYLARLRDLPDGGGRSLVDDYVGGMMGGMYYEETSEAP